MGVILQEKHYPSLRQHQSYRRSIIRAFDSTNPTGEAESACSKACSLVIYIPYLVSILLMNLAGLPPTTVIGSTSCVTTLLAPTMAP